MTKLSLTFNSITRKQLLLLVCAVVSYSGAISWLNTLKVRLDEIDEIRRDNMLLDSRRKSLSSRVPY